MAIKFNRKQLKNPTPSNLAFWIRVYSAIMVAFMAWMPTASFISHSFQDISTSIGGLTVTVANLLLPFFGVETNDRKVDIDNVTAMEEKK